MKAFLKGQLKENLAAMVIASENQKNFTGPLHTPLSEDLNDVAIAPIDVL